MNISPISFSAAGNANMYRKLGPSHPFAYREEPLQGTQADTFERSAQVDSPLKTRVGELRDEVAKLEDEFKTSSGNADAMIFNVYTVSKYLQDDTFCSDANDYISEGIGIEKQLYAKRKELLATALDCANQQIGKKDNMLLSEGTTAKDITSEELASAAADYLTQKCVSMAEPTEVAESTEKIQEGFEQYCEGGIGYVVDRDIKYLIMNMIYLEI